MIRRLIEAIVKTIVDEPSQVEVTELPEADGKIEIAIKVAKADEGKVIGRNGQTIKAIRAVVYAVKKDNADILVDIAR